MNIFGGSFGSGNEFYGGYSTGGTGTTARNQVTIEGGTFADGLKLYGGNGNTSNHNTLNLKTVIDGTAAEVKYFQNMKFSIPADMDRELTMLKVDTSNPMALSDITFTTDLNGLSLEAGDYITLVKGVDDTGFTPAVSGLGHYILTIGSTKELVYSNGTPVAKGDYTIKQGEKKWDSAATAGTYSSDVQGNVDGTTLTPADSGLSATSYSGNEVIVRRGTYSAKVLGVHRTDAGDVTGNKVTVYDGTLSFVQGGWANNGNAESNSVIIKGGTFNETYIYGGQAGNTCNATNNTVTIEGGTFSGNYKIYGGYTTSGTSSNNTLNLKIKMSGTANEVSHFQIMNFTLPSGPDDGTPMLKTQTMAFDNTTINVDASAATLSNGDIITLIDSTNPPEGIWTAGSIMGAEGTITLDGNNIIFTVTATPPPPPPPPPPPARNYDKEKAPVEGMAVAAAMVNASADLASGQGMASLVANTAGGGTDTFGAMSAGSSKYKTGSHVDVDGWGVIVGAGKTKEWKDGSATTYGLFFEYGKGDFDTYNGNVHGDGNSENKGVGIMARHKLSNNTYYEGNIRYGKQETEWSESDIGSYDTDSRYYGISVGMGHIFPVGKNEIDVYGRYTYGHVGACDATVGTSEYHFDSVKSHRVRVGGKYNFGNKDSKAKPFVGLAWEHEFKGEAKASIAGVGEAPAPSMKGNTGILEAGCDWNVSKKWTVGLGANAYMGKRKGWDGMARVFYNF